MVPYSSTPMVGTYQRFDHCTFLRGRCIIHIYDNYRYIFERDMYGTVVYSTGTRGHNLVGCATASIFSPLLLHK